MNVLLLFFAIPIAVIIFSIALQRLLRCPILVAGVIFAILLIVTFAAFDSTFLVAVIIYTILSFVTATLIRFICQLINDSNRKDINGEAECGCEKIRNTNTISTSQAASRMGSCNCCRRR